MRGYSNQYDEVGIDIARRIIKGQSPYDEEEINSCLYEMAPRGNYNRKDPFHIRYDHEGQTTYYFKVYKEDGRNNITEMSRISLLKPEYEPPHDNTPPLILKNWEVDWLIEKLKSKPKGINVKEKTLLEYIINELNKHNKGLKNGFIIQSKIKPDDYDKLKGKRPPRKK